MQQFIASRLGYLQHTRAGWLAVDAIDFQMTWPIVNISDNLTCSIRIALHNDASARAHLSVHSHSCSHFVDVYSQVVAYSLCQCVLATFGTYIYIYIAHGCDHIFTSFTSIWYLFTVNKRNAQFIVICKNICMTYWCWLSLCVCVCICIWNRFE